MDPARRDSLNSQEEGSWSSNQPFISNTEKNEERFYQKRGFLQRTQHIWIYIFHIVIFCGYSIAFLVATQSGKYPWLTDNVAYSPASGAITYQKVSYDGELNKITPYRGEPRPELDKAWHDLFINNNIRISESELEKMNRSAIKLVGGGYYGQLSVYHHLHCLKFLRQVLYAEYYDVTDITTDEHVDHCVDDIRQALMCHADTSVVLFDWKAADWRRPTPNFSVDHTCVNWEELDGWASQRSFSAFDQKTLIHPQLGIAFPLVDGKIEQISHGPGMHIVWP